ncbi:hypothetical protein Tco_0839542 [Tanacetum coccineum]|uniref:Uncharacterized protein n=1 Tax=Tanacetum coccineum TaxID=301880 RepID=A0ABQ5AQX8_9ASTR
MRIKDHLNDTFDESLPEPKSSSSVEDNRIDEPIVQDLNGSLSLQVNVSDEGYPKSLKKVRGHPIKQVIGLMCYDIDLFTTLHVLFPMIDMKGETQTSPLLADVLLSNVFSKIEAQESFPIIVGYMLYYIKTKTPFNFAYSIAQRLSGLDYNNEALP